MDAAVISKSKNKISHDKAKPFVRRGRKATGLRETAGLPGNLRNRATLKYRVVRFFGKDSVSF